jgi:hypothetical protein
VNQQRDNERPEHQLLSFVPLAKVLSRHHEQDGPKTG